MTSDHNRLRPFTTFDGTQSPDLDLREDAWGNLTLVLGGQEFTNVQPVRTFPLSDPAHGIALCDEEGHEILYIQNLNDIGMAPRRILEEQLQQREFMPVLKRVIGVSSAADPSEWDVDTDRGRTRFVVNHGDDIRRVDARRAMIVDAHGVRYLIPDLQTLDAVSRRILERYL